MRNRQRTTRPKKAKDDDIAEVAKQDYAAIELDPFAATGTKDEWRRETNSWHDTLIFAVAILRRSASDNAEMPRKEWDHTRELLGSIQSHKKRFADLSELLSITEARLIIAMARVAHEPPEAMVPA